MAEELDVTMQLIIQCLNDNNNFKLEAGAGAGKTYSLIETLKYIKRTYPNRKILCITYTNNAKNEIIERLDNQKNIIVSTIHDFIWKFISPFQKELRKEVNLLIDKKIVELEAKEELERLEKYKNADLSLKIKYRNYEALHKGIISHDRVIEFFIKFLENDSFCNLLVDSFSYIFIDEYQDSNRKMLPKLLEVIKKYKKQRYLVLGLYGDNMQHIFQEGIGEINSDDYTLTKIDKTDNYRSCEDLIKISNFLRNDGIVQVCKNESIVKNKIAFIFNRSSDYYLKNYDFGNINFEDFKRLFLVHRQIAKEVGFSRLLDLIANKFRDSSSVIKNADDRFLNYMCIEIMPCIYDYSIGIYSTLMEKYKGQYFSINDLNEIKTKLDEFINDTDISIVDFLEKLFSNNFFDRTKFNLICDAYRDTDDDDFLNSILNCPANEYFNHYRQYSGRTSLETMHGVKGNEFNNVIVNIENPTPWNWYDFANYVKDINRTDSSGVNIKNRTEKLLYVACTRAKSTLIINYIVKKDAGIMEIDNEKRILQCSINNVFGDTIDFLEYRTNYEND